MDWWGLPDAVATVGKLFEYRLDRLTDDSDDNDDDYGSAAGDQPRQLTLDVYQVSSHRHHHHHHHLFFFFTVMLSPPHTDDTGGGETDKRKKQYYKIRCNCGFMHQVKQRYFDTAGNDTYIRVVSIPVSKLALIERYIGK